MSALPFEPVKCSVWISTTGQAVLSSDGIPLVTHENNTFMSDRPRERGVILPATLYEAVLACRDADERWFAASVDDCGDPNDMRLSVAYAAANVARKHLYNLLLEVAS